MSKPTADWEKIGDRFYRKVPLYGPVFDQDLELGNHIIAGAPYAGALAFVRDDEKLHAFKGGDSAKLSIDIYSNAGHEIGRINWDQSPVKGLGWSEEERLVVVSQDGIVRCYVNLSDDFTPFTLGREAESHGVIDCRFWLTGFVALLGNNQLVAVSNYHEPRPKILATPPSDEILSWTVISPAYTLSQSVEVLLSIGQTINVVDASDSEDRMLQNGPFRHIAVSPNGRYVALFTDDGKVWVITSDFQEKLSEYDSKVRVRPKDMQWCGNDSVVLAWDDEVHVVGPNGAAAKYEYDGWVHLIPDVDGVRIFTNDVCEFLQKVPDVNADIFKLGSTSPAALLLDAADQLDANSPKADDNIQLIRHNLVDAVSACIEAAGHEFTVRWQAQLLKAASYGKSILELFDSDEFVAMTETVRVLNAIRSPEIAMPLSYDQYVALNPDRLIQRLLSRQEYLLAVRISAFLHLPTDKIYVHWASQKVKRSVEDEDAICERVVRKLNGRQGISFEEIAQAANDEGRQRLATRLLDYEPRAGKQVPLLLSMEEDTLALNKAVESGDTDLILYVLLQLKAKLPLARFFRTINSRPVATALVESTALDQDKDLLKDLYYQDDRRIDGSNLLFADALEQPDILQKQSKLKSAWTLVKDAKAGAFQARTIEDMQRLLTLQENFDKDLADTGTPGSSSQGDSRYLNYTGLSLNETIYHSLRFGNKKRAAKLQNDFRISDRTFSWIKLQALVATRNWKELEEVAASRKTPPIGWEPFFKEVLTAGNPTLAGAFVAHCTNLTPQNRAEMYVKCGLIAKAGEEALKAKDKTLLEELRGKASGRDVMEIERLIGLASKAR